MIRRRVTLLLACSIVCTALLMAGVLKVLPEHYGSLAGIWAFARGESFVISPTTVDVGEDVKGECRTITFEVGNLSIGSSLRILGYSADCGCTLVRTHLPMEIPARSSATLIVDAHFVAKAGDFARRIVVFFDAAGGSSAKIVVTGWTNDAIEPVTARKNQLISSSK